MAKATGLEQYLSSILACRAAHYIDGTARAALGKLSGGTAGINFDAFDIGERHLLQETALTANVRLQHPVEVNLGLGAGCAAHADAGIATSGPGLLQLHRGGSLDNIGDA